LSYLDQTIRYEDFIHWGAPALLRIREEDFRDAHFKDTDRVTVAYVIDALVHHPGHIVWSLARAEVLDERTLHGLGAELVSSFLDRLESEKVYIDFRTRHVSDVKTRVAAGQASLGELAAARRQAAQAQNDVALLRDAKVTAAAAAAVAAADPDLRAGISRAARFMYTTHATHRDYVRLASHVRSFLAACSPKRRAS